MKVTIDLPDDVSAALKGRWQVRRLLQLESRFQVHELLKEHHVPLRYFYADEALLK